MGKLSFSVLGAEQLGGKMNGCQMSTHFYPVTWDFNKVPSIVKFKFCDTISVAPSLNKIGYSQISSVRDLRGKDEFHLCFWREEKENSHEMKDALIVEILATTTNSKQE